MNPANIVRGNLESRGKAIATGLSGTTTPLRKEESQVEGTQMDNLNSYREEILEIDQKSERDVFNSSQPIPLTDESIHNSKKDNIAEKTPGPFINKRM